MTDIHFGLGQHIGLVGVTGSGKTYFANHAILPAFGRVLVIDTEEKDFGHIKKCGKAQAVWASNQDKSFAYRVPFPVGAKGFDEMEKFCWSILEHGRNTLIYNDEVTDFSKGGVYVGDGTKALIRKGRKRGLSIAWGSQRPQLVDKTYWTQSSHRFVFAVDEYDVGGPNQRYMKWATDRLNEIPLGSYRFFYRDPMGIVHGPEGPI